MGSARWMVRQGQIRGSPSLSVRADFIGPVTVGTARLTGFQYLAPTMRHTYSSLYLPQEQGCASIPCTSPDSVGNLYSQSATQVYSESGNIACSKVEAAIKRIYGMDSTTYRQGATTWSRGTEAVGSAALAKRPSTEFDCIGRSRYILGGEEMLWTIPDHPFIYVDCHYYRSSVSNRLTLSACRLVKDGWSPS
jgi:hypothetical protein